MNINSVNYHVEIRGVGEPLLVLHGFSGSSKSFEELIDSWSKKYKVILVDILGHGKSEKPKDFRSYEMDRVAEDLKHILDKLKINKTCLFGYSMGGRLALTFTVNYPYLVSALVLESSSPGIADEKMRKIREQKDNELAEFIEKRGIKDFVNYWDSVPLFNLAQMPLEKKRKLHQERLNNNILGLANSLRGMGSGRQKSLWNSLEDIDIPTLLIVGENDEKYCDISAKMVEIMPRARREVVKDTSHIVHFEKPEVLNKIVLDFLQGGL